MKPISIITSVIIIAIISSLFLCSSCAYARYHKTSAKSFEETPAWQKLDLHFREAWHNAIKKHDTDRVLECLIKINGTLNKKKQSRLSSAGFSPRTIAGKIITGSIQIKNVPDVAQLSFVQIMELATPLHIKKK